MSPGVNSPDEPADQSDLAFEDVMAALSKLHRTGITDKRPTKEKLVPSEWWCETHRVRSTDGPCCSLAVVVAQTLTDVKESPPLS